MKIYQLAEIPPHLRAYFEPVPELGLEQTPEEYIEKMVAVFREVRRVLRKDGTLWINIGDCYSTGSGGDNGNPDHHTTLTGSRPVSKKRQALKNLPAKNLLGIPWRVALALQADGWYLRSDIIWEKSNAMPESVQDRPTSAHEYLFLLARSERYFYDAAAIREPMKLSSIDRLNQDIESQAGSARANGGAKTNGAMKAVSRKDKQRGHSRRHAGFNDRWDAMSKAEQQAGGANKRDVWTIATVGYKGQHFATFPPKLVEPCVLAGSKPGDTVLDPFCGTGTALMVALLHGRRTVGIDLDEGCMTQAYDRCRQTVIPHKPEPVTKD